jgi:hypothetical protein
MYIITKGDVELLRTNTLLVWIRRPDVHHSNWWLGFYSTDADETRRWGIVILRLGKELGFAPFHQGCWPVDHEEWHQDCQERLFPYHCPGVAQAYEMWMGCSQEALTRPDASLNELIAAGDQALERLLTAFPEFCNRVAAMY